MRRFVAAEVFLTAFPREEIEKAWRRRIELQDADDWDGYGQTFTDDAVYVEHHEGTFVGRDAILAWLVPVMKRCQGWTFPVEWLAIDGNRVIHKWQNRLPGRRADGSCYEFAGISISEYAGDGRFSFQEDIYNWEESLKVLKEWAADQERSQTQGPP
jgi:limonene-1,2-epoxide hydrolase